MSTKLSERKLIVSGNVLELFEYSRPYAYNHSPFSSSTFVGDIQKVDTRRDDNLMEVRQSIRRLVDGNVEAHGYPPVFLTFTFKDNIQEVDIANEHFHSFIRKLTSAIGQRPKYLAVVEFQKRGAVHYHCIFFNLSPEYEIRERNSRFVANLWGAGYVDLQRIRNVKRVGPYVCKYLDKAVHDKRLRGRKAFFTSRGLLRPKVYREEKRIDEILALPYSLETVAENMYSSPHYQIIRYTQYVRRCNPCA